jgi:hypothetical protein
MARGIGWLKALALAAVLAGVFLAGWLTARTGMGSSIDPASLPVVEQQFIEKMRGAALVGRFTLNGREDRQALPDRYDIYGVDKVGENLWRFNARIGESGITLPIVVPMLFVEDTPLIMMSNATIPGLGTFNVRVFFYGDEYAGTWDHVGRGGGQMFGRVERGGAEGGGRVKN